MNDTLHIVCFDAPSPPDYGGAIELYFKIVALAEAGRKIILHYFDYKTGRNRKGLEKYCAAIYTYKRKTGLEGLSLFKPYIVSSRINDELIENLNKDRHPILLEGIHCTGLLPYINKNNRKIVVRVHNNEKEYYQQLAKNEPNFLKRFYYSIESLQLALYQKNLPHNCTYLCLSESDRQYFAGVLQLPDVTFIPCFIPWQFVNPVLGRGSYCLYHGNLSVAENIKAVEWLIKEVFSSLEIPFIIAGKNVPEEINEQTASYAHITVYNNPTEEHLASLISNAHINTLPVFNKTGVKLKLLHAIFQGRFCLTNSSGIAGSGINKGIAIANTAVEWRIKVRELYQLHFTQQQAVERYYIQELYNNGRNAQSLSELL